MRDRTWDLEESVTKEDKHPHAYDTAGVWCLFRFDNLSTMLSAGPAYSLARATFKRAQRGLFGGKHIQFGNNVRASDARSLFQQHSHSPCYRILSPRKKLDVTGFPMSKARSFIQQHSIAFLISR